MRLIGTLVLLLAEALVVHAQDLAWQSPPSAFHASADSAKSDSVSPAMRRMLLPLNASFGERTLWGDDGLVRRVGLVPALTPMERKEELKIRRTMLTMHLIGGITTLGLMGAAVFFGQRSIDNGQSRGLRSDHQAFVTATIISYSATAVLAVTAPPPLIRREEVSTITIHKTLAWVHVAGMVLTPILGGMIGRKTDSEQAHIHQISGYLTTATFAASMITVMF